MRKFCIILTMLITTFASGCESHGECGAFSLEVATVYVSPDTSDGQVEITMGRSVQTCVVRLDADRAHKLSQIIRIASENARANSE